MERRRKIANPLTLQIKVLVQVQGSFGLGVSSSESLFASCFEDTISFEFGLSFLNNETNK